MAYVNKLFNTNFLEYASYVIKDRAIPHIDDGLKPVQRRILHTLFEMDDGKFHKVANVVGATMKYHPHGDMSIYSALVMLANKDLFIDRQGNFGNIYTGDEASAARYIECRLLPLAKDILYNPEITAYDASYDGRNREPVTFPAKMPVLLVQGAEGIAVGMATKILPHNFVEVLEAVVGELQGEQHLLYPDFPTGGLVDVTEYDNGNGKVLVRAKLDTKDPKRIVIKELPFGTTTESLINSIENAARKNKIKISGINDFSAENVEIEIKLARGVHTKDTLDALYAFTDCEQSIAVNLLVIKDGTPTQMTITEVIQHSAKRLVEVLTAELKLEEKHLNDRLHARTLEQIFVEKRIYKKIEDKKSADGVRKAVRDGFAPFASQLMREITEDDIERLLKIPIRRISLYDINRAKEEMDEIRTRLKEIKKHLKSIVKYAIRFAEGIIDKYGEQYQRRTERVSFEKVDVREAAQRNLKLCYNKDTGYLGYEVSGNVLFDVSQYDRVLIIRKTGAYSVVNAPEKEFVDKNMLYCGFADKETVSSVVFSVVYRNNATGHPYLKRCKIEQFILNKGYSIIPDNCVPLKLTTEEDVAVVVDYKPKPRLKVLQETFSVKDYLVKGTKAAGVRLANKEVKSAKFAKPES
ncbi:MAG: DNA topoisomerase IV subunit A [Chitinivibrionales bacterium]|nr:DNA topoisomerase IV subunit A [Chitinivibrionales bacterium]MBD3395912.1 DNA topoisomerase IV subunit A [Chitinivibrionales bacterium]